MTSLPFYKDLELKPVELKIQNKNNIEELNNINEKMLKGIKNILDEYCKKVHCICLKENNSIINQIKNN